MTYSRLNSFVSSGRELFQNAFARYTAPSLARIFRTVVTNVPIANRPNLERDLANLHDPKAYDHVHATEAYEGMRFIQQGLLNRTGTYIKDCELPINTFQGIMENLLSNCYENETYKTLYFESEIPKAFEAFLRFAMNQSPNQAQHEDPKKKFPQLKFSMDKMQAAAKRYQEDKEFARIYRLMDQDEAFITNGKKIMIIMLTMSFGICQA